MESGTAMSLLSVENLEVSIRTRDGRTVLPVRSASFTVAPQETLALVGESGCGKSMTCLALSGLLPRRAVISGGSALYGETDIARTDRRTMRRLRRSDISVVFQDATNGLNPVKPIGWQIAEAVRLRGGGSGRAAAAEAVDLLARVGMPDPKRRAAEFPYQLSGGMNQRAMIALAVAGGPKLLIADEATTALDVTVQAQILSLIADLQREFGMAMIFVTHDLALVAEIADRVAVMYAGRVVETAPVRDLYRNPQHPYTAGLLGSLPRVDTDIETLTIIDGEVPPIDAMPPGCAFAPRCGFATSGCKTAPALAGVGRAHSTACHHPLLRQAA
jgi:peptide/nickel transport system ATP-binding protein